MRLLKTLSIFALLVLCGCAAPPPEATSGPPAAPEAVPGPTEIVRDPDDPTLLRRPFTADEIRDEWVPGLTLVMKTDSVEGGALERWTVLAADAEGAEIEFLEIDDAGNPAGEPRVVHSTWVQLRDHASFPAALATRQEVVLDTALGLLDGWVYRMPDEATGTVRELFFARSLPGAPVQMRVLKDGQALMELAQIERTRPQPEAM